MPLWGSNNPDGEIPWNNSVSRWENPNAAAWGGKDRDTNAADLTYIPGTSGQEQDVARYRELANQTYNPVAFDTKAQNASRKLQMQGMGEMRTAMGDTRDAMGLARTAAMGQAPSAAEIYGGKLVDDSINSQMAMAASARGGPSAMAGAQRQAAFQGAQTQQAGARDLAALRANEMATGREQYGGLANAVAGQANAYTGQAGAMRGQDFQRDAYRSALADNAANRQQQGQQFYEGLGFKTNEAALGANNNRAAIDSEAWYRGQQAKQQGDRDEWGKIKDFANMGAGLIGSLFSSDIRAKEDVYPIDGGSLSQRENPYGYEPTSSVHNNIIRENPYGAGPSEGPSAGLAMLRGLGAGMHGFGGGGPPMGGAYMPMIRSDDRTKLAAAFQAGAETALASGEGRDTRTPEQYDKDMTAARDAAREKINPASGVVHSSLYPVPERSETSSSPFAGARSSGRSRGGEAGFENTLHTTLLKAAAEDPMANANRAQEGSSYIYKPPFAAEAGQAPGERNVGPMAQTMAADPIAATAVKQDPNGLLALDSAKLQKLHSAGIASLQKQIDALRGGGFAGARASGSGGY